MATEGSVYRRKSDGRWVAQCRDAHDKVRYIYRKTKAEAKKALREALQDRDDGYVPPDKLTVGKYLEDWMDERKSVVSAKTWRTQESLMRNNVIAYIGDTRLSNLSPDDIRKPYRRQLRDGLAPTTIGTLRTQLKRAIRDAVRAKYIRSNPLDDVAQPKQARKEKKILSPEELKQLLDTVRGSKHEGIFYLIGCLWGLAGLYARRRTSMGSLTTSDDAEGWVFVLALVGLVLSLVGDILEYWGGTSGEAFTTMQLKGYTLEIAGLLLVLCGSVAFGIIYRRANVLPSFMPLLLIAAGPLGLVLSIAHIPSGTMFLFCCAWVVLGYLLLTGKIDSAQQTVRVN